MGNILEIIGTIVGLLYLWFEYRASIHLWITGIIMPAIYIFVYYQAGLYADFGINIYYFLIAIYGWMTWKGFIGNSSKNSDRQTISEELPISQIPNHLLPNLTAVFTLSLVAIAWILIEYTDSNVPWLDSFTTALSIVGMWMLARKYIEQWGCWMIVDIVSSGLYIYKGLYFTAALYALYAVICIFGYRKWQRIMLNQETA